MKLKVKFQRITFVNAVKGGNVPKEYIPSVEKKKLKTSWLVIKWIGK
jgi:hypothetical protein